MKVKQLLRKRESSDEVPQKRISVKMTCDDESKKLISKWIEDVGYRFKHFPDFLQLVGIESDENITIINYTKNSVKCCTSGKEFRITLFFGDGIEHASEIGITIDNTTNWYVTIKSSNSGMPIVKFRGEEVKTDDGKELEIYCNSNTYIGTLKIDEHRILQIEIDKFKEDAYKKILENKEALSRYLLTIDYPEPLEVYEMMMDILDFSEEDISFLHNCAVSYMKTSVNSKELLSTIRMRRGVIIEYAECIDEKTYHVFRNGNWEFTSNTMKISCKKIRDKDHYYFYIEGDGEDSILVKTGEVLEKVKETIVRLFEYVK